MLLNPYRFAVAGGGAGPARYWRLKITNWKNNGSDNTGDVRLAEWQLYTSAPVKWPLTNMTGNSAPAPYVASASSDDGTRFAYFAFDESSSDSNRWISSSGDSAPYLQIDLGSTVDIDNIALTPDGAVSAGGGYYITGFQVLSSSTGAFAGEEDVRLTQTGILQSAWTPGSSTPFTLP